MKTTFTALVLALALAAPAAAPAIVPPRDCGFKTVNGKRYNIKADGVRCRWAKPRAVAYLREGTRPSGWTCRRYQDTALKFKCFRGNTKSFYGIKR
jgi:hypothetical protein